MTINSVTSSLPHTGPTLQDFAQASAKSESVVLSIAGQSLQVLGTGSTPSGRSVAWVAPDLDTVSMFTQALEHRYGPGIAQSVARELGLEASPGKPLSSRTVSLALDMAETSHVALSGVDFITQLDCSATHLGPSFLQACRTLALDPNSLDAPQRQDLDHAMALRFEAAATQGRSPVSPETAQGWMTELLREHSTA